MLCAARYSSFVPVPSFVDFLSHYIHYLIGVNTKRLPGERDVVSGRHGSSRHLAQLVDELILALKLVVMFAFRPAKSSCRSYSTKRVDRRLVR